MKSTRLVIASSAVAVAAFFVSVAAAVQVEQDFEKVAEGLVNECVRIHEGDLVLVVGNTHEMELLENIVVQVRKRGALPLLLAGSDRLEKRLYQDVPARFDEQKPEFMLKMAGMIDAAIIVQEHTDPTLLASVPVERVAARNKALKPFWDKLLERNVRIVRFGNGIYPTAAMARQFNMTRDKLSELFWDGVNIDRLRLQAITDTVKTHLTAASDIRITHGNGTDLKVRIERRPIFVNDGVISSDDLRVGRAACTVWLPAGEVYFAPVAGKVDGTIVIDRHLFRGKEIRGLRLKFEGGKLISMTARSGLDPLKKLYDASGGGKDVFGGIVIGANPEMRLPADSRLAAPMATGMVSFAIGANTWLGGDNSSDFMLMTHLPGATLKADDKTLVEKGVLKP